MNKTNLVEQVVSARKNGMTYTEIKNTYGVAKSTARDWVSSQLKDPVTISDLSLENAIGYVYETHNRDYKPDSKKVEILDFLKMLAPIKVQSTSTPTKKTDLSDFCVVGSDQHFGCHDEKAINIFLQTIEELKPSTIVLNGDTMDFLAISKYPKDLKHNWGLDYERQEYHKFLDELINVSRGAKIYETHSNHSGQSVGGRWRRYLSDRIGELRSIKEITDILSYENVFLGDYQKYVEHVDHVELNGLIITHGTSVRGAGGASARAEVDKWHSSVLHGHTHRIGSSCKRIPAIGKRGESQLYGFEGGCMCSLDAAYGNALNWQSGFNIIGLGEDTFSMEQVMINNGRANIGTLGKTIYV